MVEWCDFHLAVEAEHEGDEQQQALPCSITYAIAGCACLAATAALALLKDCRQPVHCDDNHLEIPLLSAFFSLRYCRSHTSNTAAGQQAEIHGIAVQQTP